MDSQTKELREPKHRCFCGYVAASAEALKEHKVTHSQEGDVKTQDKPRGKIKEKFQIKENVHIVLRGPDGEIKDERKIENLITTAGRNELVNRWDDGSAQPTHMAIGTGTNAAAAGDTTLQTELDRNALTSRVASTNVLTMVGDWAAGDGTGAITEAGVLSAASNGTLFSRAVFSVVNKAAGDTLGITWTYTLTVT